MWCFLCGVLWFIVLWCVCCGSFVRPACPYAFLVWSVFLWFVLAAWHLVLCLGCGQQCASLACLEAPRLCAVPRPIRSLLVRGSALASPWCTPLPGAPAPGLTGLLRGGGGGRPRSGFRVPAAGPRSGGGAGLTLHHTSSGPRDGVVPGRALRRLSRGACAAVFLCVSTRSLTCLVPRTIRLSTWNSANAPRLCYVAANTPHFGSKGATPGSARMCVCVFLPLFSRVCVIALARPGGVLAEAGGPTSVCLWLHWPVQAVSWPTQAGRAPRRVPVHLNVPVAVLLFFRPPPGCLCPWCVFFMFLLFLAPPLLSSLRCF